jgi:hypothetical protein
MKTRIYKIISGDTVEELADRVMLEFTQGDFKPLGAPFVVTTPRTIFYQAIYYKGKIDTPVEVTDDEKKLFESLR